MSGGGVETEKTIAVGHASLPAVAALFRNVGAGGRRDHVAPAVGYDTSRGAADSRAKDARAFERFHGVRIARTSFA